MKALKYFNFLTLALLTACTSTRPPVGFEPIQPQYNAPAIENDQTITSSEPQSKNLAQLDETKVIGKNNEQNATATLETKSTSGKKQLAEKQIPQASRSAPSSWDLSGAMAVRSRNKSSTASVNWYQRGPGSYQIRLFGPLGSGTIMIAKRGGIITLKDGPKTASSSNAEQLLLQQTGIRLPVNNLYYWVRGLPAPGGIQSAKRDTGNRLLLLRQGGYTIQYLGYRTVGKTVLPTHIRLQGNGVFIKLVINRWSI
ncbi:outer membrane lipoprotein LolB [Legionella beliardensis]|uniref:Outer-membrane lipoprotein LolB n=1 Tax=Legionella beliardensis TaxID=91822 RepID=A0A378I4T3_9GAMM|nr:lipoprotein insertase outer membrane protein LolB [Legionella beliardensis]STX30023.1 outer membrane lipoprotein LolB [Legionella beliardensis]